MKKVFLLIAAFVLISNVFLAQSRDVKNNKAPDNILLKKAELEFVLKQNIDNIINLKSNIYLDKATVVYKYSTKTVEQLKLKLAFFGEESFLIIHRKNGLQKLFILSAKQANYICKAKRIADVSLLEKCKKEDIVVE